MDPDSILYLVLDLKRLEELVVNRLDRIYVFSVM